MDITIKYSVPPEIWDYIFHCVREFTPCHKHGHVTSYDGPCGGTHPHSLIPVISLASTCRTLWGIAQPYLLRDILVAYSSGRWQAVVDRLKSVPELRKAVHQVEISRTGDWEREDILYSIISDFSNLTELHLDGVYVTKETIDAMLAAQQLLSFSVVFPSDCDEDRKWKGDIPAKWSQGKFGPKLQTLKLRNVAGDDDDEAVWLQVLVPSLRQLEVTCDRETVSPIIHAARQGSISLTSVVTLIIRGGKGNLYDARDNIRALTSLCSGLKKLWIKKVSDVRAIASEIAPQLQYLGGYVHQRALRELLQHERLDTLQLPWYSYHFLSATKDLTAPSVRTLIIDEARWSEDILARVKEFSPAVEQLILHGPGDWSPVSPLANL